VERSHLLPSQANNLLNSLQKQGFEPGDFSWSHGLVYEGVPVSSTLTHAPSNYFFELRDPTGDEIALKRAGRGVVGKYTVEFSPAKHTVKARHSAVTWEEVLTLFAGWLTYLRREIRTPDLWTLLVERRAALEAVVADEHEDRPFTKEEQRFLSGRLDIFQTEILSLRDFSESEARTVKAEIGGLRDELKSLKRWRWTKLFVGSVVALAIRLSLPSGSLNNLLQQFLDMVHSVGALPAP